MLMLDVLGNPDCSLLQQHGLLNLRKIVVMTSLVMAYAVRRTLKVGKFVRMHNLASNTLKAFPV